MSTAVNATAIDNKKPNTKQELIAANIKLLIEQLEAGHSDVLTNYPSQGATTAAIGAVGEGIGANGIPGFVLGFDTFQNSNLQTAPGCTFSANVPCDPIAVPYMAVGQSATGLWENPWTFVNGYLNTQSSTDYTTADSYLQQAQQPITML